MILRSFEKIYMHLDNENNFLKLFFKLKKLRFGDKLDYSIDLLLILTRIPLKIGQAYINTTTSHGLINRYNVGQQTSVSVLISEEQTRETHYYSYKVIDR